MADEPKKVFISYAREDLKIARRLYDDLKKVGLDPWLDQEDLLVGENWKEGIRLAIRESSYFIALLSTRSVPKKGFVQTELQKALDELKEHPPDEIFILPVRIDNCIPKHEVLLDLNWADLFPSYEDGLKKLLLVLCPGKKEPVVKPEPVKNRKPAVKAKPAETPALRKEPEAEYRLRSKPGTLSDDDVKAMLKKYDFYSGEHDLPWDNPTGNFKNDFTDNGDGTVTDRATGLMWQQSGSGQRKELPKAQAYVDDLNHKHFAGYDDWRLPTLEELASLLENKEVDGLYIDPIFDRKQWWCWSADKRDSGSAWNVYFDRGSVYWLSVGDLYVRAVRS